MCFVSINDENKSINDENRSQADNLRTQMSFAVSQAKTEHLPQTMPYNKRLSQTESDFNQQRTTRFGKQATSQSESQKKQSSSSTSTKKKNSNINFNIHLSFNLDGKNQVHHRQETSRFRNMPSITQSLTH